MKKILITGVSGFVGKYLVKELLKHPDLDIYGTTTTLKCSVPDIEMVEMNLTDFDNVKKVISNIKPDVVFHLAAQSSVKEAWDNPALTVDVNVNGTIYLLEALKMYCNARVLLIGSSEEYGSTFINSPKPKEEEKCNPQNMYAITKLTQNYIGQLYAKVYGMDIIMTRSFNHFGPEQNTKFVIADFCNQVALIEKGMQEPIIKVGNLNVSRDFLDVRDVVNAYYNIYKYGKSGKTYNVGSGRPICLKNMLDMIIANSNTKIDIMVDENKFRPADIECTSADISALTSDTKWHKQYDIEQTIIDTLNYFRNQLVEQNERTFKH